MKKNRFKLLAAMGAAAVVLLLLDGTGGKLARPERQSPEQDKFIGFQLVYEKMPQAIDMADPNWEEQAAQIEGLEEEVEQLRASSNASALEASELRGELFDLRIRKADYEKAYKHLRLESAQKDAFMQRIKFKDGRTVYELYQKTLSKSREITK